MSGTLTTSTLKFYDAVTPSDVTDVSLTVLGPGGPVVTASEGIGLGIAVAGTVRLTRPDGQIVNLTLPVGWHPIRFKRVHATGTTATGITAGFRAF